MLDLPEFSKERAAPLIPLISEAGALATHAQAEQLIDRAVQTLEKAGMIAAPPTREHRSAAVHVALVTLSPLAVKAAPQFVAQFLAGALGHLLAQNEPGLVQTYGNKQCPPDSQAWCDFNMDLLHRAEQRYAAAMTSWGACIGQVGMAGPGGLPPNPFATACGNQLAAMTSALAQLDQAAGQAAFACNTFCGMPDGR